MARRRNRRLTGENAVLRDLLRDALEIVASEEDWTDRDWSEFAKRACHTHHKKAINGLGAWVSDGAEGKRRRGYETASRRAAPESHAEMDKLMAIIEDVNDHDRGSAKSHLWDGDAHVGRGTADRAQPFLVRKIWRWLSAV